MHSYCYKYPAICKSNYVFWFYGISALVGLSYAEVHLFARNYKFQVPILNTVNLHAYIEFPI